MGRMLLFMNHVALCTPCISLLLVSHTCAFCVRLVEQGPEEPHELAHIEDANLEQEQGKPGCI
jgi:hypothetical protein